MAQKSKGYTPSPERLRQVQEANFNGARVLKPAPVKKTSPSEKRGK